MNTEPMFSFDVLPGAEGEPPTVRLSAFNGRRPTLVSGIITGPSDTAMVTRAALSAMAYLFAQGQPVKFGPEVPLEVLK